MSSPFSCLGFPATMGAATQDRLVAEALLHGREYRVPEGAYVRWSPGEGIELWVHLLGGAVTGVSPHFAGVPGLRVGITGRLRRPGETPLDGSLRGWAAPPGDDPAEGEYPLLFDVPDAARFDDVELPRITTVQLAAFAHDLQAWPTEAEFLAAQPGDVRFAPESFIPIGIFPDTESGEPRTDAVALLAGHVVDAARLPNLWSDGEFLWARVRTLGGELDVVAAPHAVRGDLLPGAVLQGRFWLSGRPPEELAQ